MRALKYYLRIAAWRCEIINGFIAEHGMSIISSREDIGFETKIKSDCAPLNTLVKDILSASNDVHVMRDPTRGGLSSALNEIAEACNCGIEIIEDKIPIKEEVKGACELLGFDPLYVANEGKILVFVPQQEAEKVLNAMKKNKYGKHSVIIGRVTSEYASKLVLKTSIGGRRMWICFPGAVAKDLLNSFRFYSNRYAC